MANSVLGYNIGIRVVTGGVEKIVVGTTSNTFNINAETKDSITKDDAGFKKKKKTGYGYQFTIEALSMVKDTGETELLDRDDLIDLTIDKDAEIDFYYGVLKPGSKVRKGKAIVLSFGESTNSEDEGTVSLNCEGVSPLTSETLPLS